MNDYKNRFRHHSDNNGVDYDVAKIRHASHAKRYENKMNKTKRAIWAFVSGGIVLHLKAAFIESSEPLSGFSIGLLVWSIIPYAIILIGSNRAIYGAACASVVVFVFDLLMHLDAFVWSSSSTAAIGLLFMPLWNIIIFIPLSFLASYLVQKWRKKNRI